ncbi:MAG: peptide chain release factor N(5)-glutamine methyltransferase [Candidatus Moranbacteria bacterium]|nr:peptide chain release factor N(5)-glutamine methyltransferase [Candidatus Moranbacteria bacterium]
MRTITDIRKEYFKKLDYLDLELIIAHALKKSREFVVSHLEYELSEARLAAIQSFVVRRAKHEPLAYILGHKEFYGFDFKVTPNTLIPRPETESLVEDVLRHLQAADRGQKTVIDIGTGSGNIIISLARILSDSKFQIPNSKFYGIDISKEALRIAKHNAKSNGVSEKIKFLHGNLLEPMFEIHSAFRIPHSIIITANLPYLSREIYDATLPNVKKYEPKSALYSPDEGLAHYEALFKQLEKTIANYGPQIEIFLEISPEQKTKLPKLIKKHLPDARVEFRKDLAGKWRVCHIAL